jgi:hypothetical protein
MLRFLSLILIPFAICVSGFHTAQQPFSSAVMKGEGTGMRSSGMYKDSAIATFLKVPRKKVDVEVKAPFEFNSQGLWNPFINPYLLFVYGFGFIIFIAPTLHK